MRPVTIIAKIIIRLLYDNDDVQLYSTKLPTDVFFLEIIFKMWISNILVFDTPKLYIACHA